VHFVPEERAEKQFVDWEAKELSTEPEIYLKTLWKHEWNEKNWETLKDCLKPSEDTATTGHSA
jgi:hypothetical protein